MNLPSELKSRANTLFAHGDFSDALDLYSVILREPNLDVELHATVRANRSICYLKLQNVPLALSDALVAVKLRPDWSKGHYRALSAYLMLRQYQRAYRHIDRWYAIVTTAPELRELVETVRREFVREWYQKHSPFNNVAVKYIDESRGKGLFVNNERIDAAKQRIFIETPIASVPSFDTDRSRLPMCDHCLRTRLILDVLGGNSKNESTRKNAQLLYDALYGSTSSKWIKCKAHPVCDVEYCSVECRDTAYASYHEVLCCGSRHLDNNARNAKLTREQAVLNLRSLARRVERTNVLLIARLCAIEFLAWSRLRNPLTEYDAAFEYESVSNFTDAAQTNDNFVSTPTKDDGDDELYGILYRLCGDQGPLLSAARIAFLNGVILRNASDVNPISDLHALLVQTSDLRTRAALLWQLDGIVRSDDDVSDARLPWIPSLARLCISGTGLYQILNTSNHSCEPNAFAAASSLDHRISLIAHHPIDIGTEITTSYVDESGPRKQRREWLKQRYGFDCDCSKCQK